MSGSTIVLLNPTAKGKATTAAPADRRDDIRGLTVGIVDNGWWSMSVVAERYQQLLADRFGISEVLHYKKKKASGPSASEVNDEIASRCDIVITGLGN